MKQTGIIFLLFLAFGQVLAAEIADTSEAKIKQQVQTVFPELVVDTVIPSPVTGLYQLTSGPQVLYASNDGRYLIAGDVLDLARAEDRNITEAVRKKTRIAALKSIQDKETIIYKPQEKQGVVIVFTDPDCGYCRKLHGEIPKLMNLGIEVRYLAYPRQGMGSSTYTKMTSIWCAKDRAAVMTQTMQGEAIQTLNCSNKAVQEQWKLGQQLGVNGTPTLIFADGTLWGGYLSAERLAKEAIKHSLKE